MSRTTPELDRASTPALPVPFVKRVKIRNYKSIASCDVELGPLTVLVGRNGSGKSNFLDALGFVADALRTSLNGAGSRRACESLWRKGMNGPSRFSIELELNLSAVRQAEYAFEFGELDCPGIGVSSERLAIRTPDGRPVDGYSRRNGELTDPRPELLQAFSGLSLASATNVPEFKAVYRALCMMGFYNFNPRSMRVPQSPAGDDLLTHDGDNIADVFHRIQRERPSVKQRLEGYLSSIVPDIVAVEYDDSGPRQTLKFKQKDVVSGSHHWFYSQSMSDGTLRALGALVAVAQLADGGIPVRLVGIEEPETALHPAASAALMDALQEAAVSRQVVVTTHSPDLLDQLDLEHDRLLVVQMRGGRTEIGPVDRASREVVAERLATPGALLRMDYVEPDREDLERQRQSPSLEAVERPQ